MNLYAFSQIEQLKHLLPSEPPRIRGLTLMKFETTTAKIKRKPKSQEDIYNSFCGKDVLYIHTRCGGDNYESCGMSAWEKAIGDLFITGVDDDFDCTYRDTYIKIPDDKLEAYSSLLGIN